MYARIIILVIFVATILLGVWYLYNNSPDNDSNVAVCLTHTLFNVYCPGCGISHCLYNVLHLDFYQAFRYNPFVFILAPFLGVYTISSMISWTITGENKINRYLSSKLLIVIIILLILYAVLRNIPIYPFNLLAPTVVI